MAAFERLECGRGATKCVCACTWSCTATWETNPVTQQLVMLFFLFFLHWVGVESWAPFFFCLLLGVRYGNGHRRIGLEQKNLRRHDLRHHSCFLLYERGIWVPFFFLSPVSSWHSLQMGYRLVFWFSFCIKSALSRVFVLYQFLFILTLLHSLDTKTRIFNSHLEY